MLSYSSEWFRSVLNAMHDMVLVKGPRSQLLWANTAFLKYYGMTEAQLHNFVDAEHSDPDDTLQYVIDDQAVFDSASHLDVPNEMVTDSAGQARSFRTVKSPIFEDGEVIRIVGVCRRNDDTEIAKRTLDHADARAFVAPLRSLTHCFPNPMLMVDVKSRILNHSPLWLEELGHLATQAGEFFDTVYADLPDLVAQLADCLRNREIRELALSLKGPDGEDKHFNFRISPWEFPDATLGGATIIATDISELREKAEALQRANDELMQFSYRASHDLKAPLSTVKGLAKFVIEDIAGNDLAEASENAHQIISTTERLEGTVVSILGLARAELKTDAVEEINLPALVDEICHGLMHLIASANVDIRTDLQAEVVVAQRVRVSQIIENLVSNGIKYRNTDREQCFVRIATRACAGGIEISIEDNGVGIPENAKETMFELFSRFNTEQEGSGLGLSIVEKNVQALLGKTDVTSDANGSTFRVFVPDMSKKRSAS